MASDDRQHNERKWFAHPADEANSYTAKSKKEISATLDVAIRERTPDARPARAFVQTVSRRCPHSGRSLSGFCPSPGSSVSGQTPKLA